MHMVHAAAKECLQCNLDEVRQRVQRIIKVKGGRQGRPPFHNEQGLISSKLCVRE